MSNYKIIIFIILSLSCLNLYSCHDEPTFTKFFNKLENQLEVNDRDQIVLYGSSNNEIYKLVFDKSDLLSNIPGDFDQGVFQILKNDQRIFNSELIVGGGVFSSLRKKHRVTTSLYTNYLEVKPNKGETFRFYYDENYLLNRVTYTDEKFKVDLDLKLSQDTKLAKEY